jgi:trehalose 6-phosphate phosphatase
VLLDYDETLMPLITDPAAAHLSPATRQVLAVLLHHPCYELAIVSGRSLAALQARVAGLTLYLAGNHGLEMTGDVSHHETENVRLEDVAAEARVLAECVVDLANR